MAKEEEAIWTEAEMEMIQPEVRGIKESRKWTLLLSLQVEGGPHTLILTFWSPRAVGEYIF